MTCTKDNPGIWQLNEKISKGDIFIVRPEDIGGEGGKNDNALGRIIVGNYFCALQDFQIIPNIKFNGDNDKLYPEACNSSPYWRFSGNKLDSVPRWLRAQKEPTLRRANGNPTFR